MKIGILHLTDIHFSVKTNIDKKIPSFVNAVINDFSGVVKIYIVISGDIAFSGKKEEYDKAWGFLSVVKQMLSSQLKGMDLQYVIVPGNHDCNFGLDSQLRKAVLQGISYSTIGEDNSVINQLLTVQKDFWEFYGKYNAIPADRIFYTINDNVEGKNIIFNCLNTALTSQFNEQPSGLFFPCKNYDLKQVDNNGISFGVWHHPSNWFNPKTLENNKAEFENFIENLASTHFLGHEHYHAAHVSENANTNRKINIFSGEVFNEDKKQGKSGFQTVLVDLDSEAGFRKVYSWQKALYTCDVQRDVTLYREEGKILSMNEVFIKSLVEVKIPLIIEAKKDLNLPDIFVFQDLESSFKDNDNLETYFNSLRLLDNKEGVCVLDGESQVGKSSLLSMLCLKLYERGVYPILLKGKEITDLSIEKYIRRAFKVQYKSGSTFDKYLQLPKEKKAILIDDFHDSEFRAATVREFFEILIQKFGNSFVVYNAANSILSSTKTDIRLIKAYTIKPLGYKKRNEVIERYLSLKNNPLTYNENTFFNDVKELFDNVQAVLGDKLMPPYPIYILSIIQALQYKPLKNETSFGYCYQTLIHYSLFMAGVEQDEVDSYFNFLTELAYNFLTLNIDVKPHSEMVAFFAQYSAKYISPTYENIMSSLKRSKIIKSDESGVVFCYSYILYYLSAKKISDIIHTNEGKKILEKLFAKLEDEKNANVLVFVTHHSKDLSFIESSLLNLMSILDQVKPITLKKDDPYYNDIASFVQKVKADLLDPNRNRKDEREKMLIANDKLSHSRNAQRMETEDYEEVRREMRPFLQAYRAIEIVGQILKNRRGSIEKPQLKSMIEELYTTGFRTVTYYSEILNAAKGDIIASISDEIDEGDTKRQIEDRINNFLQFISFKMCLSVFSKLTQAAGNKELKKLYSDVALEINSPAAKILTFGINLSYSVLNLNILTDLAEELKDNIVALRLLKARVRGYVYNGNVDYITKQKIASILKMELSSKPNNHKKND